MLTQAQASYVAGSPVPLPLPPGPPARLDYVLRTHRPLNPFFAFQTAIRYLETRITADYPDALAVLIARVEGHIAFDAVQDMFWDLWIGSDVSLATDAGKMTRADARAEFNFTAPVPRLTG